MAIISFLLKFSGLISVFLVGSSFVFCWLRNNFKIKENTLSDCGINKCSQLFNYTLAIFGILQVLFSYSIIQNILENNKHWLIIPPLVAGLSMLFAAILDLKNYKIMHNFFAYLTFGTLIIWSLLFHYHIFMTNSFIGSIAEIIGFILIVGTILTYFKFGHCSIPEIFFIGFVFIWNLFFTYALFFL